MNDADRIEEARKRMPMLMRRLEALGTDRLTVLEARATCQAVRSRNAMAAGKSIAILPYQATKTARLIGAVMRERRAAERRAAAVAAITPIPEAA